MTINKVLRFFYTAVAAALVAGCATNDEQISLIHEPVNASIVASANGKKVGVTVVDKRADKRLGVKMNMKRQYGGHITARTSVEAYVAQALNAELSARGFTASNQAPRIIVHADIDKFVSGTREGFWAADSVADLYLTIRVKNRNGALIYDRSVLAEGVEKYVVLIGASNGQKALQDALSNAMTLLFNDSQFIKAMTDEKVQIIRSSLTNK